MSNEGFKYLPMEKSIREKNCSINKGKSMKERTLEILLCSSEGQADMHNEIQSDWSNRQSEFAGGSKGQFTISKFFLPCFYLQDYCNFSETYFSIGI